MKALAFALVLVGCGSGGGGGGSSGEVAVSTESSTDSTQVSKAYASLAALPACDAAREGQLVYVKDTAKFQFCEAGVWQVATTPTSEPAVLKIQKDVLCQATLTQAQLFASGLNGAPAFGLNIMYQTSILSNGMVVVEARVGYPGGQVSSTTIYTPEQQGASNLAASSMTLDLTTSINNGFWTMQTDAAGSRIVTYNDADLGGTNKRDFVFTSGQCLVNSF